MTMLAYTQGTTKDQVLARVRRHREADRLIHGVYWENGRGCAVGCTVSGRRRAGEGWYDAVARQIGIPAHLAALEDAIFEGLPNGDAQAWPERFLRAIPEGADLGRVWPQFAIWLLTEEAPSASGEAVAALYRRRLAGDEPTDAEWSREAEAARAAGASGAARAAGEASFTRQADKLVELCRAANG